MDAPQIRADRQLQALLDAAKGTELDGHVAASRENIELLEELHGRTSMFLDELRTARRHALRELHRGM